MPKSALSRISTGIVLMALGTGLYLYIRQHSNAQRMHAILSLDTEWASIPQPWYSVLMVTCFVLGLAGLAMVADGVAKKMR